MSKNAENTATGTAENTATETEASVASTKNGIELMIDRNPMSECKEGGWTRKYL